MPTESCGSSTGQRLKFFLKCDGTLLAQRVADVYGATVRPLYELNRFTINGLVSPLFTQAKPPNSDLSNNSLANEEKIFIRRRRREASSQALYNKQASEAIIIGIL
jgi:hypothetical protein